MMTGFVQDQHLEKQIEKQMGCMSGFFQLFDRQQILSGKRMYSHKRLPPATGVISSPEPVKVVEPPAPEPAKTIVVVQGSPDRFQPSPSPANNVLQTPPKSPLPLPIFELKEGTKTSWKFCKELAPRLSLDSRAIIDAKGSLYPREIRTNRCDSSPVSSSEDRNRRSPSVIGRLMGLEPLPSNKSSTAEPINKKPELRRSASESRVSRDLFQSRFADVSSLQNSNAVGENVGNGINSNNRTAPNYRAVSVDASRNIKSAEPARCSPWRSPQHRRSYFDSADFFPEPKQTRVSIFGEIERRLKMRGIDEQSQDLETLKQILEALQLKGLLHSKKPSSNQTSHRNFVYADESPIVLMKPWRSLASTGRAGNESAARRNLNVTAENMSPRRERAGIDRNVRSPVRARNPASSTRTETPVRSSNSIVKQKPLSIQTQRRANQSPEPRRTSPVQSPKLNTSRKTGSDQAAVTNRSPRNRKPTAQIHPKEKMITSIAAEDESSSISESTVSTSSQTDTEKSKMEEYREGRNLLERCDKLLQSIAEMNGNDQLQPSPVSVLDSSFYKDESSSSSPSPVMKRSIDFKATDSVVDFEDEIWSPAISLVQSLNSDDQIPDDADFVYISEVLRATSYLPQDSDVFFLLEKQQYLKGKDTSKASKLQRKLIFDVISEIVDRNKQLPPWKVAISWTDASAEKPSLRLIWSEFQRIRERDAADDLLEIICGALRKDLAGINGWGDQPVETSEAVLDIERLIFKDLVSETIRDLAEFAGKSSMLAPRRKLVF